MSQTLLDSPSTPEPRTTPATGDQDRLATLEQRVEQQAARRDGWTVFIFTFAAIALLVAVVAVGFGSRAIDESKRNVSAAGGAPAAADTAPATAMVHLSEFKIEPKEVTVAQG